MEENKKDNILLTFDLKKKDLETFYSTKSPGNAYRVIRNFFEKNGLKNVGDSDYIGENINNKDTLKLVKEFADENKWFAPCVQKLIITTADQEWDISDKIINLYSVLNNSKENEKNNEVLLPTILEEKDGIMLTFDFDTNTIKSLKESYKENNTNIKCPSNPYEVIGTFLVEAGFTKYKDSDYISDEISTKEVNKIIKDFATNPDNAWFTQVLNKLSVVNIEEKFDLLESIRNLYMDMDFVKDKLEERFPNDKKELDGIIKEIVEDKSILTKKSITELIEEKLNLMKNTETPTKSPTQSNDIELLK